MTEKIEIDLRLAVRQEGNYVNAYVAPARTMQGAVLIGSIHRGIADEPGCFALWKELMTRHVQAMVKALVGQEPVMTTRAAPDHERGGTA